VKPELRRKAGHYEVLGETYAKFEFFQKGWNPYSRFLDVDKVDLILRRTTPPPSTGRYRSSSGSCTESAQPGSAVSSM
jgi:hypothetical protein